MLHIWHEDTLIKRDKNIIKSSSQRFWEFLCSQGVSAKLNSSTDIRGFNGNALLANHIMHVKINPDDKYIIFLDRVLDNPNAMKYYISVREYLKEQGYANVYLSDIPCFEYLFLKFTWLGRWVKPLKNVQQYSNLMRMRDAFIASIRNGDTWKNDSALCKFANKYNCKTQEELAYTILLQLTSQNHKFLIDKTTFSPCWTCDCCYNVHAGANSCNIYTDKKTSREKARNLWNCTDAKSIISNYG